MTQIIPKGIIPYPGGDSVFGKTIIGLMPEHSIYVEPFVGSGAMWLRHDLEGVELSVLNDLDRRVYEVWSSVQRGDYSKFKKRHEITEQLIQSMSKNKGRLSANDLIILYKASAMGFGKRVRSVDEGRVFSAYDLYATHWEAVHKKLNSHEVYLHNRDWLEVTEHYDDESTFFYLDPPWFKYNKTYYNEAVRESMEEFFEVCASLSGHFLLYNNFSQEVVDCCLEYGLSCYHFTHRSTSLSIGSDSKGYIFVTNYSLPERHEELILTEL
jgi:DNA adenine methylase